MEVGGPSSPTIPPRTHQTPKPSRHRRSSTVKSMIEPSPSSRSTKSQPPSPEVISSLISSLAAISTPAEHHFDQLPNLRDSHNKTSLLIPNHRNSSRSTAGDQFSNARDPSRSPPLEQSFGVDYGAYKQPEEEDQESYLIANQAYAPVVRMSKPRAASSNSRGGTPTLKVSQQSLRSNYESASIGRLSTEPGLQPSSASIASSKSGVIGRIIGRRKSREVVSNGQSERASSTGRNGRDSLSPLIVGLRHSNSRNNLVEDRIDEGTAGWQSPAPSPLTLSHDRPSSLTPASPSESRASDRPGGIGSGRTIPSRQSSLHHATVASPGKKASKSLRHGHGSKDFRNGQDVMEEEDSTVKRIRELQQQKEKREKEQRKEERRTEKKRARNSMPVVPPQRTTSSQSLRHSMAEIMSRVPDQPALVEPDIAPAAAVVDSSRRISAGQPPSNATHIARARSESVMQEQRSSQERRPVTPTMHQRAQSDPQFSPGRESLGGERPQSADSINDAVEAYLSSPRLTQRIRHPETGRLITFSEVGDPHGFPVFCCVGMGMTRYIMAFYDELALTLRLRLITIDRPGVGESEQYPEGTGMPLNWPDDVATICSVLSVSKFSLIAHSAGAIYALATALRLPQQVRGRLHLMAPWIPPSQMLPVGSQKDAVPSSSIPYSQKLLRVLPASFLRAANSTFMSSTTSGVNLKSPRKSKRKSAVLGNGSIDLPPAPTKGPFNQRYSTQRFSQTTSGSTTDLTNTECRPYQTDAKNRTPSRATSNHLDDNLSRTRQIAYDARLTQRIWTLAQRGANPAVDLLICLERPLTIGFRYVDITRACVFHHGSRDTRVPLENVKWLAKKMRRCEVRVLEGEGHSLMASAKVMAEVLTEVAREWEDWARVTREGRGRRIYSDQFDD